MDAQRFLFFTRLFQTVIGRLSVLVLALAIVAGTAWSCRTSPLYILDDRYFITVSPDESSVYRHGAPFDIHSEYHRGLLVSGPWYAPNIMRLPADGADWQIRMLELEEKNFHTHCGSIESPKIIERAFWRGTQLCDHGQLNGELITAAVSQFQRKVDEEVADYRWSIGKNAIEKMGRSLLAAIGLIAVAAAGMWVTCGRLL